MDSGCGWWIRKRRSDYGRSSKILLCGGGRPKNDTIYIYSGDYIIIIVENMGSKINTKVKKKKNVIIKVLLYKGKGIIISETNFMTYS